MASEPLTGLFVLVLTPPNQRKWQGLRETVVHFPHNPSQSPCNLMPWTEREATWKHSADIIKSSDLFILVCSNGAPCRHGTASAVRLYYCLSLRPSIPCSLFVPQECAGLMQHAEACTDACTAELITYLYFTYTKADHEKTKSPSMQRNKSYRFGVWKGLTDKAEINGARGVSVKQFRKDLPSM